MERFMRDLEVVMHAATVVVGDRMGLYRTMGRDGPLTASQLAARTHTDPQCLREWLLAQAASSYVDHDAATDRFWLNPEQALALTVEAGPALVPLAFQIAALQFGTTPTRRARARMKSRPRAHARG